MAQDVFAAACGCIWEGGRHVQACPAWMVLSAERDDLRQGASDDYWEVRKIDEQMAEHTPPWMADEVP